MTVAAREERVYPDGRHELTEEASMALSDSSLYNEDLAPVAVERRTWTTYNYLALWVGMAHNIPTWLLASGLIALGMDWVQAILTIAVANIVVLVPMLLNSHAGTKYGIPYPVFARASFGVFGANLPALLRAGVACGWFGIQTWIGGGAVHLLLGKLLGDGWTNAPHISIGFGAAASQPWTLWLSFLIFWAINIFIVVRGMESIRRFENWAAPFILVVAVFLLIWMVIQANGLGPILNESGKVGWGSDFWFKLFPPALMGMIAFWSTLSLNMPDFTRFGSSQRAQAWGQILGLPTTMTLFPLIAVLVTSATVIVYGTPIWDPVALTAKFDNPFVVIFALFALSVATLSVNVAANVVSPSYDFSNLVPKLISFRTGGIITGILGIVIMPWNLLATPELYIFTWLGFYGGATGAIAGVLIADYWWMRRTSLRLAHLYRTEEGEYKYAGGWNWRAVVALAFGVLIAVGGAYSGLNPDGTPTGPFPQDGVIGILKPFYDYSWVAGLLGAFLAYLGLNLLSPVTRTVPAESGTPATAEMA
ncbi:MAG TPA: NCS1 family nucleobase:cation symporter-1 [Candidatus Limnocylindria bacterium]|nr:NCS1 family nucleobase:cation symporter-1 [Candidatus Limnocylindria bacterium]